MEGAISSGGDSSDPFFDASDDSAMPDFNESLDSLPSSPPGMTGHQPENEGTDATLLKVSATSLRRRRSSFRVTKPRHNLDTNVPTCESDTNLEISTFGERQGTIPPDIEDMTISNGVETTTSTLTSDQNVEGRDIGQETSSRWDEPSAIGHEYPAQSILDSLTDLVIKAIFFQVNMLIRFLTFPIWLTYNSLLFVVNPLGTLRRTKYELKKTTLWVCKTVLESLSPFIPDTLKREERIVKLVGGMAWGCFWFFYVGIALSGLLITSFFWANFLMSRIVEEPLQMIRSLSFDYTKASPDALVMLMPCNTAGCGLDFVGKAGFTENVAARAIPPNHKLQLTISLTLPESDYNINLGVFQVSVEFISTKGKITSRSSKPCMLRFKSSHIRFMETFIRSGPLLAGYSSESQVIDLRLSGFTEGYEPTMSVRIVLEQRAGFMLGAGIPEIYSASLKLESKLPILKRIIWNWRKTLLIWLAMGLFVWELLIVLVCCRPVLFPQGRRSGDASHNNQGRSIDSSTT
ncbi:seipin-3 isoform X1 [Phalaenopsis equestris]|uniref:seipin-3 isoform X1 n=1 Tax=Phalaenopsis equestris TaxID=78828 RepID=UPI0009E2EAD1|nr:seipin-3 isoform X1 [Phalaenopsis equestris]